MRVVLLLTVVAAATLLAVVPASAKERCSTYSTSEAFLDDDGMYLVLDGAGIHLYQEANEIDGLQRKDGRKDDTCNGLVPADERIF